MTDQEHFDALREAREKLHDCHFKSTELQLHPGEARALGFEIGIYEQEDGSKVIVEEVFSVYGRSIIIRGL